MEMSGLFMARRIKGAGKYGIVRKRPVPKHRPAAAGNRPPPGVIEGALLVDTGPALRQPQRADEYGNESRARRLADYPVLARWHRRHETGPPIRAQLVPRGSDHCGCPWRGHSDHGRQNQGLPGRSPGSGPADESRRGNGRRRRSVVSSCRFTTDRRASRRAAENHAPSTTCPSPSIPSISPHET